MDVPNKKLSWAAGKKTALCVGTAVIDCISTVKYFPKDNRTIKCRSGYWQRGGKASNTCTILRILGLTVEFFGVLSKSEMFSVLVDDMRQRGIQVDNCPLCEENPPFSTVIMTTHPRKCTIVNCNAGFPYVTIEDFLKLDLSKYGWIHFSGREQSVTLEMMKVVENYNVSHDEKIVISVDIENEFKGNWPLVDYCEYVFIHKQLAIEQNWHTPKEACLNVDESLRLRFGINMKRPFVICMWGFEGCGLMDLNSNYTEVHASAARNRMHSLGTGETFIGCFIYAIYVRERSETVAAEFANRMTSYKCKKPGFDHIIDILVEPIL